MRGVTDLSRFFIYMKEIWKNVVGYEGLYEVSNLGRVRKYRGKLIRMNKNYQVALIKDKIGSSLLVRNLVADAFIDNTLDMPYVVNIDGNKFNNKVDNLKWSFDRNKYTSKLSDHQIKFVNEFRYKFSIKYFAELYKVSRGTIRRILD